jgi:hypothetical protein
MAVPLFTLDSIKPIAQDAIDTLILQLGKPCRLIYPPVLKACPQGCPLPAGGKQATDVWRTGGSVRPGNLSVCPLCGGSGQLATEASEVITLLCNFNPKEWFLNNQIGQDTNLAVRVPDGHCLTKGFLTDLPKIQRCTSAVLAMNVEPYIRYNYQLDSEPLDTSNILQGRYFQAMWKRSG